MELQKKAEIFSQLYWEKLMHPKAITGVAAEIVSGEKVTIYSVSPKLILRPFADRLNIKLIGTQ